MKKMIATALCLTLGAPCFAMGPHPQMPPQHYGTHHMMTPPPKPIHQPHHNSCHHMSKGAKTAVAVAGVTGLAMIVAAIVD